MESPDDLIFMLRAGPRAKARILILDRLRGRGRKTGSHFFARRDNDFTLTMEEIMEPATAPHIFDRRRVRLRRQRSAKVFGSHDFLHRRAMTDIVDRLETVTRGFPRAVFSGAGDFTAMLTPACGVEECFSLDTASGRLPHDKFLAVVADDEAPPLARESLDLVVSLLTLHSANDLIAALGQARFALKPDGLFIAAVFGEATLASLRQALYQAETELTGGVSARIAPFAAIQSFGAALTRAGFALPVVDVDKLRVRYSAPLKLIADLRGMGETSVLASRGRALRRDVFNRAMQIFVENGGEEQFEIVYLTGWAPHENQQKPLKPGSAQMPLSEALKSEALKPGSTQ